MDSIKLETAKKIIKEHITSARCGIYDCRNIVGDKMTNIYDDGSISIDICYGWEYFEVFGLSKDEFSLLEQYYDGLLNR